VAAPAEPGGRRVAARRRCRQELVQRGIALPGRGPLQLGGEADAAALRWWRIHECPDGAKHGSDGCIMRGELFLNACFELVEPLCEFLVRA